MAIRRLARAINAPVGVAYGIMATIWDYAGKYARDGILRAVNFEDVWDECQWGEIVTTEAFLSFCATGFRDYPLLAPLGDGSWKITGWASDEKSWLVQKFKPTRAQRRWRRMSAIGGDIQVSVRESVLSRDCHTCVTCGTQCDLTIDHIKPVSKGGTNDIENLRVLCRSCNARKGDRE